MGKLKERALLNAPLATAREPRKHERFNTPPAKFTYALASYTVEIRSGGWYVAKSLSRCRRSPATSHRGLKWLHKFGQ